MKYRFHLTYLPNDITYEADAEEVPAKYEGWDSKAILKDILLTASQQGLFMFTVNERPMFMYSNTLRDCAFWITLEE